MGQFLNSINEVRKNYSKYDEWEQAQADERAKKEYLAKTLDIPEDKVELTTNKVRAVIRATEIMDKRSEDNCEDVEQMMSILAIPPTLLAAGGVPLLSQKITTNIIKKINKKITELKNTIADPTITKEAQDAAIEKLNYLTKKTSKITQRAGIYGQLASIVVLLGLGAYITLYSTAKQKQASRIGRFQAKQNELKDIHNFVLYTPEQLEQAQEIAKKIPDQKESNNILKMLSEIKAIHKDKKAYKEWLKDKDPNEIEKLKSLTYTPEQLKIGNEDKELIVDTVKEINIKAEEYSENVENAYDTLGTVSWLIAAPVGFLINKVLKQFKVPKVANRIASTLIPILTSVSLGVAGTLEQKKASRVGRYIARQDLMKNPSRLMAFSDEDMQKAKDIKAEKQKVGFFEKLTDSFSFLHKYAKDKKSYNKYKKDDQAKTEKLQKALNQIEITDKQKQDAKELQAKIYRAFDEIDEMSQRYSEDVEAGTEIAKQVMSQLWTLGSIGATAAAGIAIYKGKFPISKIVNTVAKIGLKKDSTLRTGVNKIYDVLKKDKKLMHDFQRTLVSGNIGHFLGTAKAKELNEAISEVMLKTILESGIKPNEINKDIITDIIKKQLKDGKIAKWAGNLIVQTTNLVAKTKFKNKLPEEVLNELNQKTWKDYKTLIGTASVAGVPLLGVILGVPYAFNAWLTNIQKKAGKIGIMQAMNKIDDPRVFAPTPEELTHKQTGETSNEPQKSASPVSSNLISRYKKQ